MLSIKRLLCSISLLILSVSLYAGAEAEKLMVGLRKSKVIDFMGPVKRIAIADPEIADVMVTSPRQLLVNGKKLGSTTMVVWDENERHIVYNLSVHSESSDHQVMLQVRFAEVNRTALREFGINILAKNQKITAGSFAGKVSSPTDPFLLPFNNQPGQAAGDFRQSALSDNVDFLLSIPTQNIAAVIRALEEQNLLTTLAKPNLVAIDGSEASFLAGGEFPIPIVQGSIGQQAVTIEFKEFGIRLKFVPTILDSQLINIKVSTEVSSLNFENGILLGGFRIPALNTRKTDTVVELRDGEHFVIGGLISNEMVKSVSKVPGLGNIPLLGKLFNSTRFQNKETELIIMITPKIIQAMGKNTIPELTPPSVPPREGN